MLEETLRISSNVWLFDYSRITDNKSPFTFEDTDIIFKTLHETF